MLLSNKPERGALEVIGRSRMKHPESGFVVDLVAEDGGGDDEQRRVGRVHVPGPGNELLLEFGGDSVAVADGLKVVGQRLKTSLHFYSGATRKVLTTKVLQLESPKSPLNVRPILT